MLFFKNLVMKTPDTTKYEEYKEYMDFSEYEGAGWITLRAAGWTKLIHEMLDSRFLADLNLKPIKERCWASDYDDGRRKVISLFLINDMYATIKWGWNFSYIPRISGNKCTWARTDKSIYIHTFRLSERFINGSNDHEGYEKVVFGRTSVSKPEEFINRIVQDIDTAYQFVKKDMKSYYEKTATYDGMLSELENICENLYYSFVHPENYLVRIGVENYMGKKEKALEKFEKMCGAYFKDNEMLRAEYRKKLGM